METSSLHVVINCDQCNGIYIDLVMHCMQHVGKE